MTHSFDPMCDVRFRGKPLTDLTHAEALAALAQALSQVRHLEETRPPGVWPPHVPMDGPTRALSLPPRNDFQGF